MSYLIFQILFEKLSLEFFNLTRVETNLISFIYSHFQLTLKSSINKCWVWFNSPHSSPLVTDHSLVDPSNPMTMVIKEVGISPEVAVATEVAITVVIMREDPEVDTNSKITAVEEATSRQLSARTSRMVIIQYL